MQALSSPDTSIIFIHMATKLCHNTNLPMYGFRLCVVTPFISMIMVVFFFMQQNHTVMLIFRTFRIRHHKIILEEISQVKQHMVIRLSTVLNWSRDPSDKKLWNKCKLLVALANGSSVGNTYIVMIWQCRTELCISIATSNNFLSIESLLLFKINNF